MITGTPVNADIDGLTITVLITTSEGSTSISFDAGSPEEARQCHEMWLGIIDVAVDAPGNEVWDDFFDEA